MVFIDLVFVFLSFLFSQSEAGKPLPNFVVPCKLDGSDLSQCYRDNIEKLRPRLVEGIPELQIMGFDPLHVTKLTLERNDSAAMSYHAIYTNFVLEGGKDFTIEDLKVDLDDPSFRLELRFPKMILKTDFLATGVLLGYPLKEPGKATLEINNLLITSELQGKRVAKKDKIYIDWNESKFKSTFDKAKFSVVGLFNDPNQLRLFNVAVNENEELLRPHTYPVFENSIGAYITEALRRAHKLFPPSVLYSEN